MSSRFSITIRFLYAAALLAAIAHYRDVQTARAATAPSANIATVTRIIDGDTIVVNLHGKEIHVRYIGMNAPETHGKGGLKECYGLQATARDQQLIPPGTKVRLLGDVTSHDIYGRLLAYVFRARDNLFVELELTKEGYASVLNIPPNDAYEDAFADAESFARSHNLGAWGACGNPHVAINQPTTTTRYRSTY